MFDKRMFADMRRAGMSIGLSKGKLAEAMLDVLDQLPVGTTKLKETVVAHMGVVGQMSAARDINDAWNQAKKKAAKELSDKFILDDRGILHWDDGSVKVLDKTISAANFKKLNELADGESCSVNQMVSKLLRHYRKAKG